MLAGAWQNYKSETLNAEEAQKLLAKWQALSTHALESTGFNAPELVLPILKHASPVNLNVVQQGANLHFAMPFHESKFYNSSWAAFFSAAGAPHLVEGARCSLRSVRRIVPSALEKDWISNLTKIFLHIHKIPPRR